MAGLEGFYQRTPEGTLLGPPPELPRELGFTIWMRCRRSSSGTWANSGIFTCWLKESTVLPASLIENSLHAMSGVTEARANLSGRKLHIKWDNSRRKLSSIIGRLGQIGYAAVPTIRILPKAG